MSNVITIRSVYAKMKTYHFNPMKQPNGLNYPFVKRVRYNSDGNSEMILSEAERNSEESAFFIAEDEDIEVKDGTQFDLDNPLDFNRWESIKHSDLFVPSRGTKDSDGNLIIDGDKMKYGQAELYVDVPGEDSKKFVQKRVLISKAYQYIESDSANGILTKCKLLGKVMNNAPLTDAQEFLYKYADDKPAVIIDLYTNGDTALRLLFIEAREKGLIIKKDGMFMYGDTALGVTDDAVVLYFKQQANKRIVDMLKFDTWPQYRPQVAEPVAEPVESMDDLLEEPVVDVKKPSKSTKTK